MSGSCELQQVVGSLLAAAGPQGSLLGPAPRLRRVGRAAPASSRGLFATPGSLARPVGLGQVSNSVLGLQAFLQAFGASLVGINAP